VVKKNKLKSYQSILLLLAWIAAAHTPAFSQDRQPVVKTDVPLDSIRLSDPFILADKATATYYMTGTGGLLWKSKDLRKWTGPFTVAKTDPASWMGPRPMIWAAELHHYNGRYYYFATFTNREVKIDTVKGNAIERRACHVLVSNRPDGPYVPMKDSIYLPANKPTLDATLWVEAGKPYMVYCHEWLQNWNGTVEKIELKPDLSGTIGMGQVLFRASDSPWSRERNERGEIVPNKVTDGPWVFRTRTGKLGMLWTSWVYDVYTQGVAYSSSGTLNGPWVQEKEPLTLPNYGHGMLFRTFEGKLLMAVHSHQNVGGRTIRIPHLFEVDDSGDKIIVGQPY
jgi:GH43 family beta-xylosidase